MWAQQQPPVLVAVRLGVVPEQEIDLLHRHPRGEIIIQGSVGDEKVREPIVVEVPPGATRSIAWVCVEFRSVDPIEGTVTLVVE
jgi:hypothetical protein